jgi:hypothetical protein
MIDGGKFFYTKPTLTMNGIEMLIKLTNHIALCIKNIFVCTRIWLLVMDADVVGKNKIRN